MDIFGIIFEMRSRTKENLCYKVSMGSEQCDCADTQSRCKHILALKKIVDKNYYNIQGVIKEDIFCIHNAMYEELSSNEEGIGIARTLDTVNDDIEFYLKIEDLQKSLQSFNIGILFIDQKKNREQSSKLRKLMIAVKKMIARPPTSSMLRAGSSIETQQRNVTWTRLGFNVPKTTHIHDIGESSTAMTLLAEVRFPRPDANFESRRC